MRDRGVNKHLVVLVTALIMERVLVYLWALPATLLGLVFLPLAWISGGHVHLVDGVLEISGGLVLYQRCLTRSRPHERVHVAQYVRWGPLMIPLYLLASGLASLRGE